MKSEKEIRQKLKFYESYLKSVDDMINPAERILIEIDINNLKWVLDDEK